jgi:tRNA-splicing ligase RtcB
MPGRAALTGSDRALRDTESLKHMDVAQPQQGLDMPGRELACVSMRSALLQVQAGTICAGIDCALANRSILIHLAYKRSVSVFDADLTRLDGVSQEIYQRERHWVDGRKRALQGHPHCRASRS